MGTTRPQEYGIYLPRASMRSLECLAASPILKIHHSFLEAAAVCLFSDTYRTSKIISIEDNNLSSLVGMKLDHKCLSWLSFAEDSRKAHGYTQHCNYQVQFGKLTGTPGGLGQ